MSTEAFHALLYLLSMVEYRVYGTKCIFEISTSGKTFSIFEGQRQLRIS
jgi:hypothetical protein